MDNIYLKTSFLCDCGTQHTFSSRILDNFSCLETIKPSGTNILFIGDCIDTKKTLNKRFRVTTLLDNTGKEDIRLVVGQGEKANHAKYIAKKLGLECIIIGSGAFLNQSIICHKDGFFQAIATPPHFILPHEDKNATDLSDNFALAALSILSIFEWHLTNNQKVCPVIFKEAQNITRDLIAVASKTGLASSSVLKESVLDANLKLAIIHEYLNPSPHINGAIQTAAALSRLFFVERNTNIERLFSRALIVSPVIIKAYEAFLSDGIGATYAPPNNSLRIEKLVDFFGIKEATALKAMPPYLKRVELEKQDYLLKLYRAEYLDFIKGIKALMNEALFLFFKLLPDGGFEYREWADSLELGLSIGLGSDILKGATLLSMMRDKGALDELI